MLQGSLQTDYKSAWATPFSLSVAAENFPLASFSSCPLCWVTETIKPPTYLSNSGIQTYLSDKCALPGPPRRRDSPRILRLLIRLGDLPVAVDHLHQQPAGQEHEQHIHHDLGVERRGVSAGCRAQTITRGAGDDVLFSNVFHCLKSCSFLSVVQSRGHLILSPGLRGYARIAYARATLATSNKLHFMMVIFFFFLTSQLKFHQATAKVERCKVMLPMFILQNNRTDGKMMYEWCHVQDVIPTNRLRFGELRGTMWSFLQGNKFLCSR